MQYHTLATPWCVEVTSNLADLLQELLNYFFPEGFVSVTRYFPPEAQNNSVCVWMTLTEVRKLRPLRQTFYKLWSNNNILNYFVIPKVNKVWKILRNMLDPVTKKWRVCNSYKRHWPRHKRIHCQLCMCQVNREWITLTLTHHETSQRTLLNSTFASNESESSTITHQITKRTIQVCWWKTTLWLTCKAVLLMTRPKLR